MRYNKLFFPAIVLITCFSCNKVIDIQETDLIGGDVAYKTVTNAEQGIIGAYAALGVEMNILLNATFTDEVKKSEFYNAATTHEWQYSPADITIRDNFTAMAPNYIIADRVNRVLQTLPNADSTKVGDNALKLRLRGEGLFLRAYAHFELFRYYSGNYDPAGLAMPYMETPSLEPQARIKMDEYFTKLKADLAEAKNLVPNNLTDINRATRTAVSALQARVALYTKDWANAVTYSTEYITALPLATRAEFPGIWTDANTKEVALRLIRTPTAGGRIGSLFRGTSSGPAAIGTISWMPSNKLWDSYDQANDIRFSSYLKDEPLLTGGRPTRLIQKYAGTTYGTTGENLANGKVFRTGEMYLIRAEARAELGTFTGANSAESDLNTLRAARINNYTNETFASKAAVITAIVQERFKELAFEGHRFFDLKRRSLPIERLAADAPTPIGTTLPANNFRFLLPIPTVELQRNELLVQNPGY